MKILVGSALTLLSVHGISAIALEQNTQLSWRVRAAGHELNGNHGDAASVLLRLSYTADWQDSLSTFVEFDYVKNFLEDQFSDGVRLNGQPFIFDAPGTDLNQAFVDLRLDEA